MTSLQAVLASYLYSSVSVIKYLEGFACKFTVFILQTTGTRQLSFWKLELGNDPKIMFELSFTDEAHFPGIISETSITIIFGIENPYVIIEIEFQHEFLVNI